MYWRLLGVFLKERFGIQRLFGRSISQSPLKKILMVVLLIYALGVTSFSLGFLHYELALVLQASNDFTPLLQQVASYVIGIAFLFSFFQARGSLFAYKDFDFLGSLPIKKVTLTFAKWSVMYVFIMVFSLILSTPILFVYGLFASVPWSGWVFGILSLLMLPLPWMLAGTLVSMGIYHLVSRFLNPKVLQSILMILFLLVFTFFQYQQTQGLNNNLTSNPLFEWYLPEQWVIAAFQNQFTPFLLLFVTHGGVMVTVLVFISPWLYRLNQTQNNQRFQLAKAIDYQPRSLWRHLLGMEWQRFIHSPIYILNTGFGVLMLLLASTALLFIPDIPMIIQAIQVEIPIPVESLWFAIVGFTMATVYTPAVSLSLEGKNINTIKSLPLSIMTLSMGKILFNLLITFPVLIISHLIFTLVFRVPFLEGVMTLILLGAFVIFLSTFYYWVNLLFPRFDFQQDVEVVKQSLAALIGVMGGIGWTAFLVISYTQWFSAWPSYQRYLFLTLVLMSATVAMLLAIKKWAPRLFRGFSV